MNRRGHMSAKVPNVKLRPRTRRHASPLPLDIEIVQRAWEDAGNEQDESGPSMSTNLPWHGITITFTGVDDKPGLSRFVKALGGEIESALTVNVTHVVAPGFGTPKYNYAVEHGLPVLSPSWIRDAHARWLGGEELDVPSSIEAFRLQPFIGLNIAISGIDKLERRKQIIKLITENGGIYSKDLDRSCTHLVSAWPTSDKSKQSEKIKWVLRTLGEREAGRRRGKRYDDEDPHIVYEEWLWDCIAYRGRWPEKDYDARKPRATGKVTAEEVIDGSVHERLNPKLPPPPPEDDTPVVVRKRKRETMDSLVGELLSTANVPEPGVINVDVMPDTEMGMEMEDVLPSRAGDVFERKPSVLHASRTNSFAVLPDKARFTESAAPADVAPRPPRSNIYSGLRFSHTVAQGQQPLENAVKSFGGALVPEADRLAGAPVDYVVIRLGTAPPPMLPDVSPPEVVTECWVEACAHEKAVLAPDSNLVFRPLPFPMPLAGANEIFVHVTGFKTEQGVYLRRLLKAAGMNVQNKLDRDRTTHVVLAAPQGVKYEKAMEWGMAIVRQSWVWALGNEGRIDPVEKHALVDGGGEAGPSSAPRASSARFGTSLDVPTLGLTRRSRASTPSGGNVPLSPKERVLNRATDTPDDSASPATTPKATAVHDDVTAQLRRLAEGDAAPRSAAPPRRSRPSRPTSSTSAILSTSASPVAHLAHLAPAPIEDESMRVTYADPASEKEKRKLLDAVRAGEGKRSRK